MYDIILFDLDGTLTDPKPGITQSVQYALSKMGILEEDLDKLTTFIGPPLIPSFKEFYHLNDAEAKQAVEYYRERFAVVGLYENAIYEGMKALLEQLQQQGKQLFVATSKPTIFAEKIVRHFEIRDYFEAVIGSELDGSRVEKGEVIKAVLTAIGDYDLRRIVMVGDRKFDIAGAQQHEIDVIGVTYGYGSYHELQDAKPNYIVESVAELGQVLQQHRA